LRFFTSSVLKAFSLIKEESMNIDGRRIRMAIFAMALTFATALTTSLIQPTLAGRRGGDGR